MQNIAMRHSVVAPVALPSWRIRQAGRSTLPGSGYFALILLGLAAVLIVAGAAFPEFFASSFIRLGPAMP